MAGIEGVKVGDTLLQFTSYGGRREREQTPEEVTVVKVGRTLVYVPMSERDPEGKTLTYRIENGVRNDGYGHSRLMTRESWEAEQRREGLESSLKSHGVEVWRGGPKPIAVLEALLDVMERAEQGEAK